MTAKRPPKEKPSVATSDKTLGEKAPVPAKETADAATVRKDRREKNLSASEPVNEKPSIKAGDKTAGDKARVLANEKADTAIVRKDRREKSLSASKPANENLSVAPGDKIVGEKAQAPVKETADTSGGSKARREKSLPVSKRAAARSGGTKRAAPARPESAPAAKTAGPAPKKSVRRGDPRIAARRHARLAIETLAAVMADPAAAPTMRISAATTLLQWAYGKPTTDGEGAGGKTEQVIRLAWATAGKP